MKALDGMNEAVRVKRVKELQGVWQHCSKGTDCNRRNGRFRCEQPKRKTETCTGISADNRKINQRRFVQGQPSVARSFSETD